MVAFATQVKRRRGTTAQNDAFTGAEGEIVVDTERHELRVHDGVTMGGFKIGGGSGRNIGDIFYTTRTDTALAGAVECNGGTYSTADYTGDGSIGELLASGKLPYVSLTDYATQITNNGVCGVFGWDGTGTTTFRVPTLQDVFVECGQASQLGNYIPAGLPNITGEMGFTGGGSAGFYGSSNSTSAIYPRGSKSGQLQSQSGGTTNDKININAARSNAIYGASDTVQPNAVKYRAMVQLFNSTTDEAVATVGTVVAQVGALNTRTDGMIDYVVEKQEPTAENGYTWYRKYKSGWVEQGGIKAITMSVNGADTVITLPVVMSTSYYTIGVTLAGTYGGRTISAQKSKATTTTIKVGGYVNSGTESNSCYWQVSGYAA